MGPAEQLRRIAYLLERSGAQTYRVRAYRTAAAVVEETPELGRRPLTELPGIGPKTAAVIEAALAGKRSSYLDQLEAEAGPLTDGGGPLLAALRGDLHTHSDWSDGGSPLPEMARAAAALGHEYVAATDHSPRLTVARGLSADRLREQLALVAQLNLELAPFRLLTGIEVDILDDGRLDGEPDLLAQLDIVVASVHSKLAMAPEAMTARMVAAVANPAVDVLGHCTGRLVVGRGRPESDFDAELVFEACRRFGVAVEVNSRPERRDPPRRLLRLAVEMGCLLAIDTDAHAPGQLEWQGYGAGRAAAAGALVEQVVNSWPLSRLTDWARSHHPVGQRAG